MMDNELNNMTGVDQELDINHNQHLLYTLTRAPERSAEGPLRWIQSSECSSLSKCALVNK